jgi:hypothetical protein
MHELPKRIEVISLFKKIKIMVMLVAAVNCSITCSHFITTTMLQIAMK